MYKYCIYIQLVYKNIFFKKYKNNIKKSCKYTQNVVLYKQGIKYYKT